MYKTCLSGVVSLMNTAGVKHLNKTTALTIANGTVDELARTWDTIQELHLEAYNKKKYISKNKNQKQKYIF